MFCVILVGLTYVLFVLAILVFVCLLVCVLIALFLVGGFGLVIWSDNFICCCYGFVFLWFVVFLFALFLSILII